MKRKIKDIWLLIKAKHYIVLTSESQAELNWALETLRKANDESKKN